MSGHACTVRLSINPSTLWRLHAVQEVASGPPVLSPAPGFLGDRFLGDAVWRRLRPDGMLMVNALGPEEHLEAIEDKLTRCAHASFAQHALLHGAKFTPRWLRALWLPSLASLGVAHT